MAIRIMVSLHKLLSYLGGSVVVAIEYAGRRMAGRMCQLTRTLANYEIIITCSSQEHRSAY